MPFQMRFRMLSTLLLSLIVPAGSASADMRFNFENCYKAEMDHSFIDIFRLHHQALPVQLLTPT